MSETIAKFMCVSLCQCVYVNESVYVDVWVCVGILLCVAFSLSGYVCDCVGVPPIVVMGV